MGKDKDFFVYTAIEDAGALTFENYYTNIRLKKKQIDAFQKKIEELGDCDEADYFTAFDAASTSGSHRGYWLNENADGSRADVMAYSNYSNGTWTVEFKRALNTGNADDVVFGSGDIEVTMAITDDAGGDHSGSAPFDMKF